MNHPATRLSPSTSFPPATPSRPNGWRRTRTGSSSRRRWYHADPHHQGLPSQPGSRPPRSPRRPPTPRQGSPPDQAPASSSRPPTCSPRWRCPSKCWASCSTPPARCRGNKNRLCCTRKASTHLRQRRRCRDWCPPATNGPTPGTGGFAPPPFPPPPPGLVPAPSSPTVLPGRPAEEQEPTILRQDRNDGPTDKTPRISRRARAGAELADPKVTGALARADWRAHHLINVAALRAAPELIAAAARAGWRIDAPANVAPLPASREAQETLKAAGIYRPVHDSGHQNWNDEIEDRLKTIEQELLAEKDQLGTEAYDRQARKELEELQNDLRQKMMQLDRLTENGLVSHTASV